MKKPVVQKEKVVITPHPPKDTTPTTTSQESPAVDPETDSKENPPKEVAKDQVDTEVE